MSPILVVGAGPTGLVLAIELQRRGVPHILIDQRPAPLLWDRAAVIKARTLEIFAALGLQRSSSVAGRSFAELTSMARGRERVGFDFVFSIRRFRSCWVSRKG
jgi:2-polyprenyl-6-methoxyphenol hydroxylase-like FAD-dependent oxidoreductase